MLSNPRKEGRLQVVVVVVNSAVVAFMFQKKDKNQWVRKCMDC